MHVDNLICVGDFMSGVKDISDETFDIIISDPPYNIGKDFGNDSDKMKLEDYLELSKVWVGEWQRLLKPTGTIFIYGFDEILSRISAMIPVDKQHWLIWYYTNKNVANLNFWQRSHESIICTWKDNPIFNTDAVREPYTEGFVRGSAGKTRPVSMTGRGGNKESIYNVNPLGALPRDVIAVPALAGGAALTERIMWCETCGRMVEPDKRSMHLQHDLVIHPTQKPMAVTERLIKSCKPEGEFKVLIPFCGSGSECLCTMLLGGKFLSFDMNERYVKMAQENIRWWMEGGVKRLRSDVIRDGFAQMEFNL